MMTFYLAVAAADSNLPTIDWKGPVWSVMAFLGIVMSIVMAFKPKINWCGMVGLACFFTGWFFEAVAHVGWKLWHFSVPMVTVLLWIGISLVAVGLIFSVVGIAVQLKNEHRFKDGLSRTAMAFLLNACVIFQLVFNRFNNNDPKMTTSRQLRNGFLVSQKESPLDQAMEYALNGKGPDGITVFADQSSGLAALAIELAKNIQKAHNWKGVTNLPKSVADRYSFAKEFFSSETGEDMMAMTLTRDAKIKPGQERKLMDERMKAVKQGSALFDLQLVQTRLIAGFSVAHNRYWTTWPKERAPTLVEHWIGYGDTVMVELIFWGDELRASKLVAAAEKMAVSSFTVSADLEFKEKRSKEAQDAWMTALERISVKDSAGALVAYRKAWDLFPNDLQYATAAIQTSVALNQGTSALELVLRARKVWPELPALLAEQARLSSTIKASESIDILQSLFDKGHVDDIDFHTYLSLLLGRGGPQSVLGPMQPLLAPHGSITANTWKKWAEPFQANAQAPATASTAK